MLLRRSHFEIPPTTLPTTSSISDLDLRAPYLGDFSADVSTRYYQSGASQANFLITCDRLDSDLRNSCLRDFCPDMPVRPSQLDASLRTFPTSSSIPTLDLSTMLQNQQAATAANTSFLTGFPDPWVVSDPSTPVTSNILDSDLRAPYFGNYPMDLPTRVSQLKESPTTFVLKDACVGISPLNLPEQS